MGTGSLQLSGGRRRLVDLLKRVAPATPPQLARDLGISEAAVRQHLDGLAEAGLAVGTSRPTGGRGRPATEWRLTDLAVELFPDRHADLTVELLGSVRRALGEEGLARVIDDRARQQGDRYRAAVPPDGPLRPRVEALARCRAAEGYLAEVVDADDGALVLVEHHCPVCEAAAACQGLCRSELDLFREILGPGVSVERTQHVLAGDPRCAYRIREVG